MPENRSGQGDESESVTTQFRHPRAQKDRWERQAENLTDGNLSAFIRSMTEAGLKPFTRQQDTNETIRELRQQLREKDQELRQKDDRITRLERKARGGERGAVIDYLRDRDDGASFDELLDHVTGGAAERLNTHLRDLRSDGRVSAGEVPTPEPGGATSIPEGRDPGDVLYWMDESDSENGGQ